MTAVAPGSGASIAELLGVLSLGIDLGLGLPMEHMLRSCTIALALAERSPLDPVDAELVSLTALLAWVGCHTDSYEQAYWFGDDIARRAALHAIDRTPRNQRRVIMGLVGAGLPPVQRARRLAEFTTFGRKSTIGMRTSHCRLAGEIATGGYLVGDSFTVADLTAAALFYGVARPLEFPYPMVASNDLPESRREFLDSLARRPGGQWVAKMYRRHRGRSDELSAAEAARIAPVTNPPAGLNRHHHARRA